MGAMGPFWAQKLHRGAFNQIFLKLQLMTDMKEQGKLAVLVF